MSPTAPRVRGERDRAEKNFQLAMQAVDEMLTEVGEEQLATEPRMEEKRKALLAKALVLYREFLAQKGDDERVRLQTAHAHRRMADILRLLGQHDAAREAYDEAVQLLERLHEQSPADATYRQDMAYCHNMRGEALRALGQLPEAEESYERAHGILATLSGGATGRCVVPAGNGAARSTTVASSCVRPNGQLRPKANSGKP